ncbi:ferritin-like domain-containing protein [Pelagibius litoralis]|uniref:Ferritin-like domain-containing protein n=1 Tax=Pelagibius litoralis TaxID=374515 RepID=A0A967EWM6_9PROT|nr:ferritin-like domain-containing protein [Pelagibius litoralis]NIA67458.1 ferritin-like domain-containing protein [Pelagibius litoralis]
MTDRLDGDLRDLLEKGHQAARRPPVSSWQAIADWPEAPDDRLAVILAGQFLLGEEVTAQACRNLSRQVPLASARDCLALQAEEEQRHAALYRRFLQGRSAWPGSQGLLTPAAERIAAWQGPPEAVLLALHVIIEGEALAFQETARRFTTCPRFAALSRAIARDEARHVAFGQRYLPAALPQLTPAERQRIYIWLRGLWFDCMERLPLAAPFPGVRGVPLRLWAQRWARHRWAHWQTHLRALGLFDGMDRKMQAGLE